MTTKYEWGGGFITGDESGALRAMRTCTLIKGTSWELIYKSSFAGISCNQTIAKRCHRSMQRWSAWIAVCFAFIAINLYANSPLGLALWMFNIWISSTEIRKMADYKDSANGRIREYRDIVSDIERITLDES